MIIIGKNTIKTHTHTERYFVYCIYTLSSIVVVVVVFLWIFRRFSLVAFAGCTAHVHCFHETATALATGHGPRKRITGQMAAETEFSRLSPLSVNLTRSLSPLCTLPYALISPLSLSRSLLMIARATPTKYLTNTQRSYMHTYMYIETIYDRIHRIFLWKIHMTNDSIANGNTWLRVADWGLGVAGCGWYTMRISQSFCFSLTNIYLNCFFFLFWKNP